MKKRVKGNKNKFNFLNISNKLAFTLIALSIIILFGIGVYAYGTTNPPVFGHTAEEINLAGGIEGNAVFNSKVAIGTYIASVDQAALSVGGIGGATTAIYGKGAPNQFTTDTIGVQGDGTEYGIFGNSIDTGVYGWGDLIGVSGAGTTGVYGSGGTAGVQGSGGTYGVWGSGSTADFYASMNGYKFPDGSIQKTSSIPSTGTGPFCIFAKACPTGWTDNGLGGYIYNSGGGATCPYTQGGSFNSGWTWCNPRICCHS